MENYILHPQTEVHIASDQSGILLYSGFTGSTVKLAYTLLPLINALTTQTSLSESQIFDSLSDIASDQVDEIWHVLLVNYLVVLENKK